MVVAAATLVATCGAVLAWSLPALAGSPLRDGHGTATFTWHDLPSADEYNGTWHQPFTGKIEGLAVKGTASPKISHSGSSVTVGFAITGSVGGTKLSLVAEAEKTAFKVNGHFGTLVVRGTIAGTSPSKRGIFGTLMGTVGAYRVTAHIRDPIHRGKVTTVSASFDISGS